MFFSLVSTLVVVLLLWVCCLHVFSISILLVIPCVHFLFSFSLFFYLYVCMQFAGVCGWLLSLSLFFSDTWQMVVVMSKLVSRGVVAFFSNPPSFLSLFFFFFFFHLNDFLKDFGVFSLVLPLYIFPCFEMTEVLSRTRTLAKEGYSGGGK